MNTAARGSGGPAVRRILLATQLHRLRTAQLIAREQAGKAIGASVDKINRMETGRARVTKRDMLTLLDLYGVADPVERERVLAFARQTNEPGWWHTFNDLLPEWFEPYVGLEEAASRIRTYEVQFVPGLLQTAGYARAVTAQGRVAGAADDDIERRVHLRMTRAQLLTLPEPPQLWAVIDEAALRRPIGGRHVMRAQLEHLLEAAKLPTITLQVMPLKFGGHVAEGGAFSLLRFPYDELPDVVYLEQLTGALYLDGRGDVNAYTQAIEDLCVQAEEPNRSADMIADILAET